jgi:preprotein translocase subunit YajC
MDPNSLIMILIFGGLIVFFYFTSRSQKKRAQQHQDFRDNLKKGSVVQTTGGFIGKVVDSSENEITLEHHGSKSTWKKAAIAAEATLDKETKKLFGTSEKSLPAKKAPARKTVAKKSTTKKAASKK